MGLGSIRVGGFGRANGFGLTLLSLSERDIERESIYDLRGH